MPERKGLNCAGIGHLRGVSGNGQISRFVTCTLVHPNIVPPPSQSKSSTQTERLEAGIANCSNPPPQKRLQRSNHIRYGSSKPQFILSIFGNKWATRGGGAAALRSPSRMYRCLHWLLPTFKAPNLNFIERSGRPPRYEPTKISFCATDGLATPVVLLNRGTQPTVF